MMDRLPRELVEEIVLAFSHIATKNDVLDKRLVCHDFNRILRPLGCRTLALDTTRLNKQSKHARPRPEALQTIGYRCKALHVDMSVLRDDYEVDALMNMLLDVPSLSYFLVSLRYSLLLPRYRSRPHLPPVPNHWWQRPEEDSATLKTLVLEGVADDTLCELWMNPSDVMNMQNLLSLVETLVLQIRRLGPESFPASMFGAAMWNMIYNAVNVQSLTLASATFLAPCDEKIDITRSGGESQAQWQERRFPGPGAQLAPPKPTYLELRDVALLPDDLLRIATAFGPSLEELHMNEVSIMTHQSVGHNTRSDMHLWVGLPNEDPGQRLWMAMRFRALMPKLRICRCSKLDYRLYLHAEKPICETFDRADPAAIGRPLSQRFVEVVMGHRQPRLPSGEPIFYHSHDPEFSSLTYVLSERRARIPISEHDYVAHRLAGIDAGRRYDYEYSLDGQFRNCIDNSFQELSYLFDQVHSGMRALKLLPGPEPEEPEPELPEPEAIG
ncbi:hypothetical protein LMH87_011528 [Akanthomyces muscarius]|uniref:Uncharacterized protein n=1 Tax=Akanthomyces muscarius TaxID=2231603 RepID=A0A9W8Q9D0_AKAMU|nr:hypothetical protein LMH87_011528 [Akanthomyces muscarius]KAJ4150794.1 hypothetical protein LMH87_011528 [Akanthomyces muscarius]